MLLPWTFFIATCLAIPLTSSQYPRQTSNPLYFFNFGDSYTQNGFVFDLSGTLPSPGNPTGHPAVGSTTWSLGPVYTEWLVTQYNNTNVFDYDFGWGGATVNASIVSPSSASIATFEEQVTKYFEPMFSSQDGGAVPWTGDNSIFSIFFGINDIIISCASAGTQAAVLDSYFNLAANLYNAGARRFLFIGVPPVDRSPVGCNSDSCDPSVCSDIINSFNGQLAGRVEPWAQSLDGVTTSIYDFHAFMEGVLDNPTQYGFANATCAGNGNGTCIWQDQSALHTGYIFQSLVAQNMVGHLTPLGW